MKGKYGGIEERMYDCTTSSDRATRVYTQETTASGPDLPRISPEAQELGSAKDGKKAHIMQLTLGSDTVLPTVDQTLRYMRSLRSRLT